MSGSGVSRRSALRATGALGAIAGGVLVSGSLAACDLRPGSSSSPTADQTPGPDEQIVQAARAELSGLLAQLSATRGTSALAAVHRAQLAALQGRPRRASRQEGPLTPAQIAARERRAARRFGRWALASRDGDLARVLASIAAGIRMQPILREST